MVTPSSNPPGITGTQPPAKGDSLPALVTRQEAEETVTQPSLREWQQRCGEWVDLRWPDDTLEIRALMIAEEGGEIARCVVKGGQDIRGGQAHWRAESEVEAADLFFTLASFAHRAGFDLQDAIARRWEQLRDRQWPTGEEAV